MRYGHIVVTSSVSSYKVKSIYRPLSPCFYHGYIVLFTFPVLFFHFFLVKVKVSSKCERGLKLLLKTYDDIIV